MNFGGFHVLWAEVKFNARFFYFIMDNFLEDDDNSSCVILDDEVIDFC